MATRGTKPKPTRLRVLEGKPGHRPLNKNEPKPPKGAPDPPDHLDDLALEEWHAMAPGLAAMGILSRTDKAVFAAYCENYSITRRARLGLKRLFEKAERPESALIYADSKGVYRVNPLVRVAGEATDRAIRCAAELGMTPSARARLSVAESEEDGIKQYLYTAKSS